INASGTVVGSAAMYVSDLEYDQFAVRWDAGKTVPTVLGGLGAAADAYSPAIAFRINDAGTIVGSAAKKLGDGQFVSRPVRWNAGSNFATELKIKGIDEIDPNGAVSISASADLVNTAGTVIGSYEKSSGVRLLDHRAVRWEPAATAGVELGNLGTSLS